ncbi:MAG: Eco57I restriction-modification methylase domain-containing protein [Treponema sp.]|jgi:type I restriction-modification system DNA methylase subunit|nr:Eco57I restriction-modification methylase domain-containing protein [Treponema sp.]
MTIHDLAGKYEANRDYFRSSQYNETQLRTDFLDPLFELLGWDIKNNTGKSIAEREVILEESLKSNVYEHSKKPDYTFRLFSNRTFFLEAKKPSVAIESNNETAKQVRRYGYTAKLKVSVLSNFEFLMIYDTSVKVDKDDTFQKALVKRYHYSEYEQYFDDIKKLLGKESVYSGFFDKYWEDIEQKIKHYSVDELFLQQINEWRVLLGKEIFVHKPDISETLLNDVVQSYLNRIIFLRVCEDRTIEDYRTLFKMADEGNPHALITKFKEADHRYNSGIFDQLLKDKILVDVSSVFWTIIRQLYYPESPYSFSVFSSDILGNIYEIFLSEKLTINNGSIGLERAIENRERDIVTTPSYIIDTILKNTVLPGCEGKSDAQILAMKFADIACGSGAFLLKLYQMLQDILTEYYIKHDKSKIVQTSVNTYRLCFDVKNELLLNCIFGFDKDFNAIEAAKFGLLLKLLEDETLLSLDNYKPVLPSLEKNILFGNSLMSPEQVSDNDRQAINPFDFTPYSFDIIIGNPPYMKSEDMKNITPLELPLYKKYYKTAYKQFDKYFLFIEKALKLLKADGLMGFIVPSKFIKVGAGKELRGLIAAHGHLKTFVSFGPYQVFAGKTNYTCLLFLSKNKQDSFQYYEINEIEKVKLGIPIETDTTIIKADCLTDDIWVLLPEALSKVYTQIISNGTRLEDIVGKDNIFNGIQTSANDIYIFTPLKEDREFYYFSQKGKDYKIEKDFTKPYFKTSSGEDNLYTYRLLKPNARVIYPYHKDEDKLVLIPLKTIKVDYPSAYAYLMEKKPILNNSKRDIKPEPESDDEWYCYGRHQSLENCILPEKIIVGVLSLGDKYAIDTYGALISSGGTAGYCAIGIPEDCLYSVYYIQAILNSKYLEWFCSIYGDVFRGGYIARGTKVLNRLPIRTIDFSDMAQKALYDDIVRCQKELVDIFTKIDNHANDARQIIPLRRQFADKREKMDHLLKLLYGLEDKDSRIPLIKEIYAAH